ncbi:MAG: hypothetical protein ISN28_15610 [Ectothiorhodospiraceae bacterium AqS1]|nr:hypothetical protein [Ectothiorhodospiraceae bacterium AqS1]MBF2761659.1 hypothetical protein [Ectothiorhodospiraceae bacterium AqS1]
MMIIYSALVVTVWGALAGAFFLGAKGLSSPAGSSPVQQVEVPARQAPARDVMDGASDEIGDARPASLGFEHGSFLVSGSEKNRTRAIQAKHPTPAFSRRPWKQ